MKQIGLPTLEFLIKLKSTNVFWFLALINCARKSPALAKDCVQQAAKHLNKPDLIAKDLNFFEISYAVNQGYFDTLNAFDHIDSSAWRLYRDKIAKRMNEELFK